MKYIAYILEYLGTLVMAVGVCTLFGMFRAYFASDKVVYSLIFGGLTLALCGFSLCECAKPWRSQVKSVYWALGFSLCVMFGILIFF